MYRLLCGVLSRCNICKSLSQRYVAKTFCGGCKALQRNNSLVTKVSRCDTTLFHSALPLWMLLTAHPFLLSATVGSCLKWVWRDIPMNTIPDVLELMIAKKRFFSMLSFIISSFALLVYVSGLQKDPLSKRRRFIALNKKQIQQLAELQFRYAEHYMLRSLPYSDTRYHRLRRVMKRLLSANSDLQSIEEKDWEVFLIDMPYYANALAMHNGKVFVYTGMLHMCNTDDQLGFVLAHEISHVVLLHMPERFSKIHLVDLLLLLPLILMWTVLSFRAALVCHYVVMHLSELFIHLPAKRHLEYEADSVGLNLAAKACFDVRDASVFWHKIQTLLWVSDGKPVEWISTHPGSKARRKRLDKQMSKAVRIRDQHHCPKLPVADPRIAISEEYRSSPVM